MVCGMFVLDSPFEVPILATLPPVIRITPDAGRAVPAFLQNVQFIAQEIQNAANSGFACITTACGVTPHAQNTGTSPGLKSTGSPKSGRVMSAMPIAAGSPMWTGVPWALGKRAQMVVARIASAGVSGPSPCERSTTGSRPTTGSTS